MKKSVHPRARWHVFFAKPRRAQKLDACVFYVQMKKRGTHVYVFLSFLLLAWWNEDCIAMKWRK